MTTLNNSPTLRFAALGSGSEGNAMIIEFRQASRITRLLLDCGFSSKELDKRLAIIGLLATDLNAVLITHEHHDHAAGAYRVAKRWRLPLYATFGTFTAAYSNISPDWINHHALHYVTPGLGFMIGDIAIHPIPVPHDAREPVQYRFSAADRHLAVLTDAGSHTSELQKALNGLHALVLECNHDADMLRQSAYPPSLKQRILGDWGHLSNEQAAKLLAAIDTTELHSLWCAHLSKSNNSPALAQMALAQVLGWDLPRIKVLGQSQPGDWFVV
jgi:phosphoribosyl 1,2-cyclic phosphodiesterase